MESAEKILDTIYDEEMKAGKKENNQTKHKIYVHSYMHIPHIYGYLKK